MNDEYYNKSRIIAQELYHRIPDIIYEDDTKKEHQEILHDLTDELGKFINTNFETPEYEKNNEFFKKCQEIELNGIIEEYTKNKLNLKPFKM